MSAFIVSKQTMDRAVDLLWRHGFQARFTNRCELGQRLYAMNLQAVQERYPGNTKESAPGPCDHSDIHEHYRSNGINASANARLENWKALNCLIYQCSEGTVPALPLFKQIDRASDAEARAIVMDLPGYQQAGWDD